MPRAYLYLDETGLEVFRITDVADRLESPTIGAIIELRDNCYRVEAVRMVPSRSLATEYRVTVLLIAEPSRVRVKGADA